MARKENPNRAAARECFVNANGKITNKEIADKLGIKPAYVCKWKKADKWEEALPKKRGAPKGNQNAVGGGAPLRNVNAETHGAYTQIHLDNLTEEQDKLLKKLCPLDTVGKLNYELQRLFLKEHDLENRLVELRKGVTVDEDETYDPLHIDRKIVVDSDKGEVTTTVNVSTFQRCCILEAELDKTHGRILKVLKAITDFELKQRSQRLAEKHYVLQKQRITGTFNYNDDGSLSDEYDLDDVDDLSPEIE